MLCVECQQTTPTAPCAACGQDPHVGGRYALTRRLGAGSFGVVYLGVDTQSGDSVAVKEVLLGGLDTTKARELARREGAVLRQLAHPGIPGWRDELVMGVGRAATLYLVQDFIAGDNLQDSLVRTRWSEEEVLDLMDEVLDILHYLHTRHPPVVHRDIKPANLIRRASGELVLVDFGSVRDALRGKGLGGSTVAGTFGFMAPEQFGGDAFPQTDLYGLGMTAVVLLSRTDAASLHSRTGSVDWERLISVSEPTTTLLRALLQPEPTARLQSATTVKHHIARIRRQRTATGEPLLATPTTPPLSLGRPTRPVAAPSHFPAPTARFRPSRGSSLDGALDLRATAMARRSTGVLATLPPAPRSAPLVKAGPTARQTRGRQSPGLVKGCLFTALLYGIFGVVGLLLFWMLIVSKAVVVGL